MCDDCRKRFTENDKVVIQHAKDRHYTNPQTGLPAYYHPLKACIQCSKHPLKACMQSKWGAAFNQVDTVKNKLSKESFVSGIFRKSFFRFTIVVTY